jgi:MoaA/NifB/PqqE/SkfB family radical SAM enzyme
VVERNRREGRFSVKEIVGVAEVVYKIFQIRYFKKKLPVFGSADITNFCNLKCKHCYWWLNRTLHRELSADEWRNVVREKFIKNGVVSISLTGGEPLLRPDVIEAIISEMGWRYVTVVTNGTLPLIDFGVGYFISIDGTESVHDAIRGMKIYGRVRQNVREHPWAKVSINMTINSLNYKCVEDVADEWYSLARAITFQFHTPSSYDDELWLPYGKLRNSVIDRLLKIKEKYPDFVANTSKQLNLFRSGKWTARCPTWFFINLDSGGKIKRPCVISSIDGNGAKPICERCGIGCYAGVYSGLFLSDTEWLRMLKVAKRVAPFKNELRLKMKD